MKGMYLTVSLSFLCCLSSLGFLGLHIFFTFDKTFFSEEVEVIIDTSINVFNIRLSS